MSHSRSALVTAHKRRHHQRLGQTDRQTDTDSLRRRSRASGSALYSTDREPQPRRVTGRLQPLYSTGTAVAIHAVSVCAPLSFSSTLNESSVSIDVSHYWPSNDVGVREMTLSGGQTKLFLRVPFTSVFVGGICMHCIRCIYA